MLVKSFFLIPWVSRVNSHGLGVCVACCFNLNDQSCRALDAWMVHMNTPHGSDHLQGPEP